MESEKLFELAKPYLEKNGFGVAHTKRVFDIARKNFDVPVDLQELVFNSIILHDIGGSSIKEQYENGPKIATSILKQLNFDEKFIKEVCDIICTHHGRPEHPSQAFKILYDSDKLVMFSTEEFSHYDSKPNFNWNKNINLMYSKQAKDLAKEQLQQRMNKK